ncbi:membrane protein [Intrasporangium oryzae NRRL B-24470]|uniref:Membrane protein n=1 Tax=Intrasporangium oryzae NRRL B-24470 TaxID=1386089 RepID=W9GE04_9MICO|nr:DUF389 domain-containing protein [Intrasporangium oryzae]EWT02084.1 membrane protein [Intrasporangium oryzae NRRL B-24470]
MAHALRNRILPANQRRTLDELTADLDLTVGDTTAKRSAFWTMLVLAGVIATAGVLADSTATVIGAMIIAPLSTPIMGMALGLVKRERLGGLRFVVLGALLVIAIGALFSLAIPGTTTLLDNSQIAGRTSPRTIDLVAALATGLAGAVALARRDVGAVLPGVAISISLVPPLGVVGVCLGEGEPGLALGAFILFLSNLLALVFAGMFVFTTLGYTAEARERAGRPRAAYATLAIMVVLVLVPLVANSLVSYGTTVIRSEVRMAAQKWLSGTSGAELTGVDVVSTTILVRLSTPGELPSVSTLLGSLDGKVPGSFPIVIEKSLGERIEVGTVAGR